MEKVLAEYQRVQDEIEACQRLGARPAARNRDGRHAPAARRRRRHEDSPAASGGASPSARSCSRSPTCCCSTSRPTISTPKSVAWLERHLADYPGTVVAVTHDRYFLDNVAGWILELDRGRGIPWKGNYSSWLEQKQARLAVEEKAEPARARKRCERELEWIRMSPRAGRRRAKPASSAYEAAVAKRRFEEREQEFEIQIPPGKHLGDAGRRDEKRQQRLTATSC